MNTSTSRYSQTTFWIFISVLIIVAVATVYVYTSTPKIAYVRNLELIQGFNGLKSAQSDYQAQAEIWQNNIDTLNKRYKAKLDEYNSSENKLSKKEKQDVQMQLRRMKEDIDKYTNAIGQKAREEDAKISEALLNQINSFVESYAKQKGYDIVFGAQGDGTIMYGKEFYDITNEVLIELNKEYKYIPPKTVK